MSKVLLNDGGGLTEYLTTLATWHAANRGTPEGWKYGSYEALVLAEGTSWDDPDSITLDINGELKDCYQNSLHYAIENGLLYCEGYAQGSIIPVMHAWVYDPDNDKVIETTWRDPGSEYYGVAMDPWEAGRAMVANGYYGLLANDWVKDNRLLRDGFPSDPDTN